MWWREILPRFRLAARQPREAAGRWLAYCPVHEADGDHWPSLSIWLGRAGDRLLLGCWAGCAKQDVLKAAGLKMQDLFVPENKGRVAAPRIVKEYDYLDEQGRLLFQVVRLEPKSFRQRRLGDDGYWHWGLNGVRLVPYRLPQILARPEQPVVIVEGERDADTLAALGLEATTNPGGTGMGWQDSYSVLLAGRRVAMIPDADEAGRRHMERVVGSLIRHGVKAVRWVELPGGKDASECVESGKCREWLVGELRKGVEYRR